MAEIQPQLMDALLKGVPQVYNLSVNARMTLETLSDVFELLFSSRAFSRILITMSHFFVRHL